MPIVGYCQNLRFNLCPCFVCGKKFSLDNGVEDLLTHTCFTHHIAIENIESIADFQKYMEFYVKRMKETSIESFTSTIIIEVPENDATPREQKYYILGKTKEDEELRKMLHNKRLKAAQKQQKKDLGRQIFLRHCFYCQQTIEVTNAQFILHLRTHGFHLGHPDKLVYIVRFVEAIEDNFRNLQCLYCDAKFDSYHVLKKHMVERNHQKIHPNNRFYDQFYMINYLEFGKTWLDFNKEKPEGDVEPDRENIGKVQDWSGWDAVPEPITCLLCEHISRSWDGTLLHMQALHKFDFKALISPLKFYHQVKVVNYLRRRISENKCIVCDFTSESNRDVINHMEINNHLLIPDKQLWNQSCYFIPTKENDAVLFHLEDKDSDDETQNWILPTTDKSDILHRTHVENSETESVGSASDTFYPADTARAMEALPFRLEVGDKMSALELSKKSFVEIEHWMDNNSNNVMDDIDSGYNTTSAFDAKYDNLKLETVYMANRHLGAGDYVATIAIPPNENSTKVKMMHKFGNIGPKGDF